LLEGGNRAKTIPNPAASVQAVERAGRGKRRTLRSAFKGVTNSANKATGVPKAASFVVRTRAVSFDYIQRRSAFGIFHGR
jgi:hypothetical protein